MTWLLAAGLLLAALAAVALWWRRRPWSEPGLGVDEAAERIRTMLLTCEPGAVTVCAHEGSDVELRCILEQAGADRVRFAFRVGPGDAAAAVAGADLVRDTPEPAAPAAAADLLRGLVGRLAVGQGATFRVHTEGHCSGPRARRFLAGIAAGRTAEGSNRVPSATTTPEA